MLRMEKFDKNFSYAMREMGITINFFLNFSFLSFTLPFAVFNSVALNVFESPIPRFSYSFNFFSLFLFLAYLPVFMFEKLFEIHKSFMHIHHVLKLMNHLRGFPMMNGRCCIGNNNDVSLFISAFFPFFFSRGFSSVLFWIFIICSRKRRTIRTLCMRSGFRNLLMYYVCVFDVLYWTNKRLSGPTIQIHHY